MTAHPSPGSPPPGSPSPGLAGGLTRAFITSPLTPLFLLAALALGALALFAIPREEEPQIKAPMIDVHVRADGLAARDVVELVTEPLEEILKGLDGVEHIYSQSRDDGVVVTARFFVGTDEDDAILRVHEALRGNFDRIPLGIPEPLVVRRGIDDVAILTLVLTSARPGDDRWDSAALYKLAEELRWELVKTDNVGLTYLTGGKPEQVRIEPDPDRLALYGVTLNQLVDKIRYANSSFSLGTMRHEGEQISVLAGQTLQNAAQIGQLLITTHDGRPVYVKDVATIMIGPGQTESRVWNFARTADSADAGLAREPAVSLAIAKRKGANAVRVAADVLARLDGLRGRLIPEGVTVQVVRDYGKTAQRKSDELLSHLLEATATIVVVILLTVGWREAGVVAIIIPATILFTFFITWLLGFTLNRVSLFGLIFSIGILVDDAIVVVENIVRHWRLEAVGDRARQAVAAVAEVGNPTIIATLTIIAALLPMMFVTGLMGPYMNPIPVFASSAMLFSFFVAVIIAPWLLLKFGCKGGVSGEESGGPMGKAYRVLAIPLLVGRRRSAIFLVLTGIATVAVCGLFITRDVTVKLLPFDNKSEMQVVIDLPEGASLEETDRTLTAAAHRLTALDEVVSIQAYVGTAAPFNFNGLVRHYYLRNAPNLGSLKINLTDKEVRQRQSHDIALAARKLLAGLPAPKGTDVKVVEMPPGPPVMATLLAEVYGPDAPTRRAAARRIRAAFDQVDFIVDVSSTVKPPPPRLRLTIDQENLEYFGVEEEAVYDTMKALLGGVRVGYSHRGGGADPIEIAVLLPKSARTPGESLLSTPVPARGGIVELGDVARFSYRPASPAIFRRDGRYAEMVMANLAGRFEAPLYGMLAVNDILASEDWGGEAGGGEAKPPVIAYHGQPADESFTTLLWDGEWEVTYVTFRDMGAAFGVALLAIYFLLVGQFGSFKLPLLILVPVPLTLIGIVLGHWALGAPFTATSMIGFIALAGIIVRNSILLVDFIRVRQSWGEPLREALIEAGSIRFRPIFLTAVTAMIGAAFILTDPIFQGLAISMLFGLLSSTALTVFVIPAVYVVMRDDGVPFTRALWG